MEQIAVPSSTWRRALIGFPFLLFTVLMLYAFSFAEPVGAALEPVLRSGVFSVDGVSVPLHTNVFGIPVLDDFLNPITAAFMHLIIHAADPVSWWQTLVFLSEFSGLYGMLLLESSRPVYKGSIFRFPFLLAFPGQFVCIGVVAPLYFYAHYVFTPQTKLLSSSTSSLAISTSNAFIAVLAVGAGYWIPQFISYFHASYEVRNWWCWMWQVYPVWGSIVFFAASTFVSLVSSNPVTETDRGAVRVAVGQLAFVATGSYWYTLSSAELPLARIFVPGYFFESPQTTSAALRTVVQYDYICSFAGVALWLLYSFAELKAAKVTNVSVVSVAVFGVLSTAALGFGTTLLLGWLWRDEILSSEAVQKYNKKKQ